MEAGQERGQLRHLLGAVNEQIASVDQSRSDYTPGDPSDDLVEKTAGVHKSVRGAEPEARAHLGASATGDTGDVMDKVACVHWIVGEADSGTDRGGLLRIGQRLFVKAKLRRRNKADRLGRS